MHVIFLNFGAYFGTYLSYFFILTIVYTLCELLLLLAYILSIRPYFVCYFASHLIVALIGDTAKSCIKHTVANKQLYTMK